MKVSHTIATTGAFPANVNVLRNLRRALARCAACLLLTAVAVQGAAAQQPEKKIGFGVEVSADGFFSTTLARVSVNSVTPDSQAAAAGVVVGDEVVRIQGITVPGNSAATLKEHMEFVPGVPKRIVFKRANGTEYEVTLTRALPSKSGG